MNSPVREGPHVAGGLADHGLALCADQKPDGRATRHHGVPDRPELQDVQELSNFFERRVSAYQVGVTGSVSFDDDF